MQRCTFVTITAACVLVFSHTINNVLIECAAAIGALPTTTNDDDVDDYYYYFCVPTSRRRRRVSVISVLLGFAMSQPSSGALEHVVNVVVVVRRVARTLRTHSSVHAPEQLKTVAGTV